MTPERWQQVKGLLQSVLEQPTEDQTAFLNQAAGGDDPLRLEVESLLEFQEGNENFIETSALEITARSVASESQDQMAGAQIGPFQVEREIGRGGMGAVYLAQQNDNHYQRQVAIKIIKRGMDSDEIVQRFRNERQILANLTHPNIAGLYSGGTTDTGLPFFVMEYVEGKPINEYCEARNLSIEDRLKLFRTICSAISYAHQNLVIHRDLKPSNILVTNDGVPKLLDFGIAKLLNPDVEAEVTETMLRVMTPEYASPEQARGERMTTASDVYSLSVVLYELLTGRRPYRLKNRLPHEIAQIISERVPERPSTAISRSEEMPEGQVPASTITAHSTGNSELAKLRRSLRGDLDNIVLMGMRKDPARRYQSVEQFSEDIRRHLEKLPVRARKDTFDYRASKFIRRNRLGVAAAAVVILVLSTGIIATRWQAHRAERRFNEVRALAHSVLFDYHDAIARLPGATPVRQMLVKDSLKYLDSLAKESSGDRSLQLELATAYYKVGDIQGRPRFENLGDTAGALQSYQKALAIRETALATDPASGEIQLDVAMSYARIAEVMMELGEVAEALQYSRKATLIIEPLSAAAPNNTKISFSLMLCYALMGDAWDETGDLSAALESHLKRLRVVEAMISIDPQSWQFRRNRGAAYDRIGNIQARIGKTAEALQSYQKALAISEEVSASNPLNVITRRDVGSNHYLLGKLLSTKGDHAGALEEFRKQLLVYEALSRSDPTNALFVRDLGGSYQNVGESLGKTGDALGALQYLHKAITICESATIVDPTNMTVRNELAVSYSSLGDVYARLASDIKKLNKRTEYCREAIDSYQKSLDVWQELRNSGRLTTENAGKPDEITREIAKCNLALASAGGTNRSGSHSNF